MWYEVELVTEKDHLGFEGIYSNWIFCERRSDVIPSFIMQYYCRMGDDKYEGPVKSVKILSVRSSADVIRLVRLSEDSEKK